ncbi:terminase large subunit [Methylophaga sp.]|uniref:terminase large subunit n=1 Tax=Methylophaga sp. TaxID=2024840 RepID=UPI003A95981E
MANQKIKQENSLNPDLDPVTSYALDVTKGKIIAGPHVRDSCKRHLDDLEHAHERGFYFDVERVQYALDFFEHVLVLNGGEFEGKPYIPIGWQAFVIGSLFGWINEKGLRRFRVAYIETGKGSGKSPLAAGIGMFGLVADNEPRAEIYAAATKKDQAMILFRDAVAMVDQSPNLSKRIVKSGTGEKVWNLSYPEGGSFFRPVSADDGQSGPRPHVSLLDEIHEHKNGNVVKMMRAGTKGRTQALMLMITNSGHNKNTICWEYHDYGAKVAAQQLEDDAFFTYICALDEGDDPLNDESCWAKANPSLGVTIQPQYLRELVKEAKGMPSAESSVKRLNFCMWVGAESPWISADVWLDAQELIDEQKLYGRDCYLGIDLSSTQDLTAGVFLFEPTESDPYWRIKPYFWLPDHDLKKKGEKDGVNYLKWVEDGHLETTPGKAVSKLFVAQRLVAIAENYNLKLAGYDRWRIEDLKQSLADEGQSLPLEGYGQGYKDMGPAVSEFETLLLNGQIKHNGNPVLTWCAANAVTESDPAENKKISKSKATGRVDGIVATLNAIGMTLRPVEEETESVYETRGIQAW